MLHYISTPQFKRKYATFYFNVYISHGCFSNYDFTSRKAYFVKLTQFTESHQKKKIM